MEQQQMMKILVLWRGKKLEIEIDPNSKAADLGRKLQMLTDVKPDTLRLLVPQSANKSSKLVTPLSDEHSNLSLQEIGVIEGKPIRMMGVFEDEIKEVSNASIKDSRILGFDEEEKRLRQRSSSRAQLSMKLPQGPYIFCDFRTLHLPGIELNPPPSEALKRMHKLACDPGIIAIMNKHRWRVGIMTEMAPVGYVGVSPKCILGFNKNKGEEISLRLRTDDLKGFRKYESIKKTLLHELAHMVHSDHDAKFLALDSQLNKEAATLDWTRSQSHTLSGHKLTDRFEEEIEYESSSSFTGQKLGGVPQSLASARAASVAAAYDRFLNESYENPNEDQSSDEGTESDSDDGELKVVKEEIHAEQDRDDVLMVENDAMIIDTITKNESTSNDRDAEKAVTTSHKTDLDETVVAFAELNSVDSKPVGDAELDPKGQDKVTSSNTESDPSSSQAPENLEENERHMDASDSDAMQIIEEPVLALCTRIRRAVEQLKSEVSTPAEAASALQTLFRIIRNVIDHPEEVKFKKLRKANPQIQRNVVNYKAAMEVLFMVGFCEDLIKDGVGKEEAYLVLKRNDPGLLWLAKSQLEVSMG